jgi:hypothetical protein
MLAVLALAAALFAGGAALAALHYRGRARALRGNLDALGERLREISGRLDATEQDAAQALAQAGLTTGLLVEKGLAEAEEFEELRRRLDGDARPGARAPGEALH